MDTLRTVRSVCPECVTPIPATVKADDEGVYMEKECPDHGPFTILLSAHPKEYRELYRYYNALIRELPDRGQRSYFFYITSHCNLGCPICYVQASDALWEEPSLDFIKEKMSSMTGKRISLFGGEPTVRKDLAEIVRIVRETGNVPVLFTNGLAISDRDYLRTLKEAGVREVHLQFDGFDDEVYRTLRTRELLEVKMKALENLRVLEIPTVIKTTIARGLNEGEIRRVIDYAVENPFVQGLAIKSYVEMGSAGLEHAKTLRADELLDLLSEQTDGTISNTTVVQFHKALYSLFNILSWRWCENDYLFFIERRTGGGFTTLNEVFDLDGMEPVIERFVSMRERGSWLATPYVLLAGLAHTLRPRTMRLLANAARLAIGILRRKPLRLRDLAPDLIIMEIGVMCNPDNFEYERASRCPVKQLTTKGEVGMCFGNLVRERQVRRACGEPGSGDASGAGDQGG